MKSDPSKSWRNPLVSRWIALARLVRRAALLVLAACVLTGPCLCPSPVRAQGVPFNQRDDQYPLLGLRRAKEAYEVARREFERQETLFKEGLISQVELDRARNGLADAEVNYQQSLLAVLFEEQVVSVSGALKYQDADGLKRVRLTLSNTSGGSAELQSELNLDDPLFRSLRLDVIRDVYVSILNAEGAIISDPYESKIEELHAGSPERLDFALLQDLDAVTVNMFYANGTSRSMKIFLKKDESVNKVVVQSEQFSQEVELGSTATFDLTFELFSSAGRTFRLEVVNLPAQINRYFKDPATNARLSQFRFTQAADTRRAALEVSLPDRATGEIPMDRAIPFYVLVIPEDGGSGTAAGAGRSAGARFAAAGASDLAGGAGDGTGDGAGGLRMLSPEEIERAGAGYVRLELVPRGKGQLVVRAPQLFHSVKRGRSVDVDIDLANEGTRKLDNVSVKLDPPLGWSKSVEPAVIPTLEVGGEERVHVRITPDKGTGPGRYEVRIRTDALSDNEPMSAEDKSLTVEILPGSRLGITLSLVVLILGLVTSVVVFGIKLSRR